MNEAELIRRAMSALGKRTSERKKISSRKNAKRPRKKKVLTLDEIERKYWPKPDIPVAEVYIDPTQFPKA